MPETTVDAEGLFAALRAEADPVKAAPMSAYMRNQFSFLGLPTPRRRQLTRPFFAAADRKLCDWGFVEQCWEAEEREFQYAALDYLKARIKVLSPADVPLLRGLAVRKSWWDSIDVLDRIVGGIALRFPEVNEVLLAWSVDENIWLRRIAIDHQLTRGKTTDTVLLERIIVNCLDSGEFFIDKAIGWSLRQYSKTDPEWVRGFLDRHQPQLARLSITEASKYL